MKRKPPASKDSNPQEAVQNYLDQMLTPVSKVPGQKIHQLPERAKLPTLNKVSNSLKMVGGTTVSSAQTQQHKQNSDVSASKPFAEPVLPLTLRMPLPTIQSDEVVEPKTSVKENVSRLKPSLDKIEQTNQLVEEKIDLDLPAPEADCMPVADEGEISPVLDNGRPCWAQDDFDCLLFTTGGLTLAVPLTELGTIYKLDSELTSIFGQADWLLGLLSVNGFNIRTVNTTKVVMPERYNEKMIENFSFVVTINNVDWGLAVDSVSTAIRLSPDDVRWRTGSGKRPWLAGTVINKMCALLDVSQLAEMLTRDQKG